MHQQLQEHSELRGGRRPVAVERGAVAAARRSLFVYHQLDVPLCGFAYGPEEGQEVLVADQAPNLRGPALAIA